MISQDSYDMNVFHICSYYSSGFYQLLIEALRRKNVNSKVFYFGKNGYDFPYGDSDYVDCAPCFDEIDRWFFLRKEKKVWEEFAKREPTHYDLIHAHSLFSNGYIAYRAKAEYGIPYIVAVRNTDINTFFKRRINLRRIGHEIMKEAERIIFLSPAYKKETIKYYVPQKWKKDILEKSIIVPNGIDDIFFQENSSGKLNEKKLIVLQVGVVSEQKNQLGTLKACKQLISEGLNLELRIVGRIASTAIGEALRAEPFVKLIPYISQKELMVEYQQATVMCMPSYRETFGLSYIESMSQGTPVVCSEGQGIDGYFQDGSVGFSVDPRSTTDISRGIMAAYEQGWHIRKNCIRSARQFDWCDIANTYKDIYESALI